jgi:hypothetical protein
MTVLPEQSPAELPPPAALPAPAEPPAAVDTVLRVLAMLLALGGGAIAAALAVLLVPLRIGSFGVTGDAASVRIPVAIVLAVAGNVALVWFARYATGVRWAPLLPGISWFAVIVLALNTTTEGDRLLMPNDWVGTITLFAGTITFVISTMLAVVPARSRDHLP